MTTARRDLVDTNVTRYYHCISRCVRGAFLCGEGFEHRRQWIEKRLQVLAKNFAISIAGFSVMQNHFHLVVRLDESDADNWSVEEVLRRWINVFPPARLDVDDDSAVQGWIENQSTNRERVEELRQRLTNLGWFMKALKEPLSKMANREDDCRGAFWEGRYKSIAILDEEALLATCVYVDLNPVAAGIAETPESSSYTSIRQRIEHIEDKGRIDVLKAATRGSVYGSMAAEAIDQDHWLIPIEDRRRIDPTTAREGMLESFSLGSYLMLIDYTSRLCREGKCRISNKAKSILDRIGNDHDKWFERMGKMLQSSRLYGRVFGTSRVAICRAAKQFGLKRLANLTPHPCG